PPPTPEPPLPGPIISEQRLGEAGPRTGPLRGRLQAIARCRSRRRAGSAPPPRAADRKSTRLNSSHVSISYAVFCLKKKNKRLTVCCIIVYLPTPGSSCILLLHRLNDQHGSPTPSTWINAHLFAAAGLFLDWQSCPH